MTLQYSDYYCDEKVTLSVHKYYNGNLAIYMNGEDGVPFSNLTVNFEEKLPEDEAYRR